jgi:hypothetical protein
LRLVGAVEGLFDHPHALRSFERIESGYAKERIGGEFPRPSVRHVERRLDGGLLGRIRGRSGPNGHIESEKWKESEHSFYCGMRLNDCRRWLAAAARATGRWRA